MPMNETRRSATGREVLRASAMPGPELVGFPVPTGAL